MYFIGIDPGKSGALAVIYDGGDHGFIKTTPFDERDYINVLADIADSGEKAVCCLEHVSSMPKQGVASTFTFGENFGWIQGVLSALDIPFQLVRPQKWKKHFGITADKNSSVAVCKRLFPNVSLVPTEHHKKDNDGIAEALLMALYAERNLK